MAKQRLRVYARQAMRSAAAFHITESYKVLCANLQFALAAVNQKVVLVSSAEPSVGKSTTATNLALTYAQRGDRVLLIDADMRKPKQHRLFQMKNELGLADLLGGLSPLNEVLHKEVTGNLDLITAGRIPPNPSELLASEIMKALLEQAINEYDVVLVDTPPINMVVDVNVLSSYIGAVLLVSKFRSTTYGELENARSNVEKVGGKVLGVVINEVTEPSAAYRYSYRKYYSYNYQYSSANDK